MEIIILLILTTVTVIWRICRNIRKKSQRSEKPDTRPPPAASTLSEPRITYKTPPPPIPDEVSQPFDYQTGWWKVYSIWYRSEKGWRCEACQLSLRAHKHLLHTHHIWGTRQNQPQDLMALCIGCHSKQPGYRHENLKNTDDYQEFIGLYGKKWRLLRAEYSL